MTRFKTIGIVVFTAATAAVASPTLAAPLAVSSVDSRSDALTEQVAYGCGPGWTVNRWGECRPMYRRYGYYGPRSDYYGAVVRPRPVFHVGPFSAGVSFY